MAKKKTLYQTFTEEENNKSSKNGSQSNVNSSMPVNKTGGSLYEEFQKEEKANNIRRIGNRGIANTAIQNRQAEIKRTRQTALNNQRAALTDFLRADRETEDDSAVYQNALQMLRNDYGKTPEQRTKGSAQYLRGTYAYSHARQREIADFGRKAPAMYYNDPDRDAKVAVGRESAASRISGASVENPEELGWMNYKSKYMTPEQRAVYNYLVAAQGSKAANNYMESISGELNRKAAEGVREYGRQMGDDSVVGGVLINAGASLGAGLGYADALLRSTQGRRVDTNSPAFWSYQMEQGTREGIKEHEIPLVGKPVSDFLIDVGLSTTQSAARRVFGFASLPVSGLNAATGGYVDAKDRGLTNSQAMHLATANGAFEMLFEYFSLDNLEALKTMPPTSAKMLVKNVLSQAFVEGQEEAATDFANTVADNIISGKDSEFARTKQSYIDSGMSESDATFNAVIDYAKKLGLSFAGGALSGGIMGGGAQLLGTYQAGMNRNLNQNTSEIADQISTDRADYESDSDFDAYQKLKDLAYQAASAEEGMQRGYAQNAFENAIQEQIERDTDQNTLDTDQDTNALESEENTQNITENTESSDTEQMEETHPERQEMSREDKEIFSEGFEKNGKAAVEELIENKPEEASYQDYYKAITKAYNAGRYGFDLAPRDNVLVSNMLSNEQFEKAYKAGALDRNAEIQSRPELVKGEEKRGSITVKRGAVDSVTNEQKLVAEYFAKKTGHKIVLTNDSNILGSYEKGRISVSINSNNFNGTLTHETGHMIKVYAPNMHGEWLGMVVKTLQSNPEFDLEEEIYRTREAYKKVGQDLTRDEAIEEIVNNSAQGYFNDEEFLKKLATEVSENKTLTQKVIDFFNEIIEAFTALIKKSTRREAIALEKTRSMYEQSRDYFMDAMKTAGDIYKAGYEISDNMKRYQASEDTELYKFASDVISSDNDVRGFKKINEVITSRLADDIEKIVGFSVRGYSNEIDAMQIKHIWKRHGADGQHDHSMKNVHDIAKIGYIVDNHDKVRLGDNRSVYRNADGSKAKTVEIQKKIGDKFFYVVEAVPDAANKRLKVVSAYINKNDTFPEVSVPLSLNPDVRNEAQSNVSSNNIIEDGANGVNKRFQLSESVDSKGNALSKTQQEYFKDSVVRNNDGRLLVMYHGSPNAKFTEFKPGTYFTTNKQYADGYQATNASALRIKTAADAPGTYEVYLNIKNPFDTRIPEVRDLFYDEYYRQWGTGTDLQDKGLPDWTDGMDIQDFIEENELDFDGIILDEGGYPDGKGGVIDRGISYIVLSPEQVKNVDNQNPTESKDIRYQLNEDSDGRKLSNDQKEYFKDSSVRDDNGRLLAMYHGTSNSGFTIFNTYGGNFGLFGKGSYFTDDPEVAISYTEKGKGNRPDVYEVYLNIKNPLDMDAESDFNRWKKAFDEFDLDSSYLKNIKYNEDAFKALKDCLSDSGYYRYEAEEIVTDMITSMGFDGITHVGGGRYSKTDDNRHRVYIAFEQNQIKNISNKKPTEHPDIRFQLEEIDGNGDYRLQNMISENKALKAERDALAKQLQLTSKEEIQQMFVRKVAQKMARKYHSDIDQKMLERNLTRFYEYMNAGNDVDAADVQELAAEIGGTIISKSRDKDTTFTDQYSTLRNKIKDIKIAISDQDRIDLAKQGGYNNFRKKYFGKMKLGKDGIQVDSLYQELVEEYPEMFDKSITHPADQIVQIGKVIDDTDPRSLNQYQMDEMKAVIGHELVEEFFDVRNPAPTMADKMHAEMEKAKRDYKKAIEKFQEDVIQKQKAAIEKKRDRVMDMENRKRLLNLAKSVRKMKLNPQNSEEFKRLAGNLDLLAVGISNKKIQELTELRDEVYKQAELDPDYAAVEMEKMRGLFERLNQKRISDMTGEEVSELTESLIALRHSQQTFNRTLREDLNEKVSKLGSRLVEQQGRVKGIDGRNKILEAIGSYSLNMKNPTRALPALDGYQKDGVFTALGKGLNDGQTKMRMFEMESKKMFDEVLDKNPELVKMFSVPDIDIGGGVKISKGMRIALYLHGKNHQNLDHIGYGGILIPDHKLYEKGDYKNAYRYGRRVQLTPAQINNITKGMTDAELQFARVAQQFLNHKTKDAINETSLTLNGYYKANVENYFPIRTDPNFLKKEISGLLQDGTIEGMGMLKERQKGARNPVLLEDVANVIDRQISNTSRYVGLAIPVRDFNKVFGYTERGYNNSVVSALDRTWGAAGKNYVTNLLKDIQTGGRSSEGALFNRLKGAYAGSVLNLNPGVAIKQTASYPFALTVLDAKSLAAGLSKAFTKADYDYMDSITPWSYMRRMGMSGTEVGEVYKQRSIVEKNPALRKAKDLTNWIQNVDVWTTNRLFAATEAYVKAHNPDLEVRGAEYNKKVADLYNEVLQRTQPSYDVMQRNEYLRSDSTALKALTAFKTQTFNMGGEIMDAYGRARAYNEMAKDNRVTAEEAKEANKHLRDTVLATITSQAMLVMLGTFAKTLMHQMKPYRDKNGRVTAASVAKQTGLEFVRSFAGVTLGGAEVQETILAVLNAAGVLDTGDANYDVTLPSFDAVNKVRSDMVAWTSAMAAMTDNPNSETRAKAIQKTGKLAMSVSAAFGKPANNIYNIVNAAYLWGQDAKNGELGTFEAGRGILGITDTSNSKATLNNRLFNSLYEDEDRNEFDLEYEKLSGMYGDVDTELKKRIKKTDEAISAVEGFENFDDKKYNDNIQNLINKGFDEKLVRDAIQDMTAKSMKNTYDVSDMAKQYLDGDIDYAELNSFAAEYIAQKITLGMSVDKAKNNFRDKVSDVYRPLYKAAKTRQEKENIIKKCNGIYYGGKAIYQGFKFESNWGNKK